MKYRPLHLLAALQCALAFLFIFLLREPLVTALCMFWIGYWAGAVIAAHIYGGKDESRRNVR